MKRRPTVTTVAADVLWDSFIVALIALVVVVWPDIFPSWMAFSGLPLLACRAAISTMELTAADRSLIRRWIAAPSVPSWRLLGRR